MADLLLVVVTNDDFANGDVLSVGSDLDGAFTKHGEAFNATGEVEVSHWYIEDPTPGAHSITVTLADSGGTCRAAAISFLGVHATTPLDTLQTATGFGESTTDDVTTAVGDIVVGGAAKWDSGQSSGTGFIAGPRQVAFFQQIGYVAEDTMAASWEHAIGATTVHTYLSTEGNGQWAAAAVAVKTAGGTMPVATSESGSQTGGTFAFAHTPVEEAAPVYLVPDTFANVDSGVNAWTSPANAQDDNGALATVASGGAGANTDRLVATGLGALLPDGANIVGIEARLDWVRGTVSNVGYIGLTKDAGATLAGSWKVIGPTGIKIIGGAADLWGASLSEAEVENANFGVMVYVEDNSVDATCSVDYLHLLIYYSMGAMLTQEGYRWRDDDGSEAAASWLAAQDANISRAVEVTTRLRTLVDVSGDAPSAGATLQYRKVGDPDTEWRTIS